MDYHTFQKLQATLQDPETLGTIPPVLAVGFGVIPLEVLDSAVLMGHVPEIYPGCLQFLEDYYCKEIVPVELDEKLAMQAINEGYIKGKQINHDTFDDPDFVLKPENESRLLNEKVESIGTVSCGLEDEEVVFLESSYYSLLVNLDRPEEEEEGKIESEDIPFKIINGVPRVHQEPIKDETLVLKRRNSEMASTGERSSGVIKDDTLLVERRNYSFEGCQHRQGIARHDVSALPFLIHPTEIQITQIHADGSLTFHVYDHLEKVAVGSAASFRIPYHFISLGHRYSRVLTYQIHALRKFRREKIVYVNDSLPWGPEDTERWFHLGG